MASVNIIKIHGDQEKTALLQGGRNREKDTRGGKGPEGKERYETIPGGKPGMTEREYRKLKNRVEKIDKKLPPLRVRKDRVTMVRFDVSAPEGLPPEKEKQFFELAYNEITKFCGGKNNVSRMTIDRGRIHDYMDPVTKQPRTSRIHGTMAGIPYMPGKGVNCRNFMSRDRLWDLQHGIDKRCRSELGVRFLNGTEHKKKETQEAQKPAPAKTGQGLEGQIAEQKAYIEELKKEAEYLQVKIAGLRRQILAMEKRKPASK